LRTTGMLVDISRALLKSVPRTALGRGWTNARNVSPLFPADDFARGRFLPADVLLPTDDYFP
jgi:hypothetical protein